MCDGMSNFIKCIGAGIIMGALAGMFCLCKAKQTSQEKGMKRKAKEALGTMDGMMEEMHNMFCNRG